MKKKIELTRGQLTKILHSATGNVKDFVMDNDKFIDEQLEAINYTHCCTELPTIEELIVSEIRSKYKKQIDDEVERFFKW